MSLVCLVVTSPVRSLVDHLTLTHPCDSFHYLSRRFHVNENIGDPKDYVLNGMDESDRAIVVKGSGGCRTWERTEEAS
jgi:hypothetical protein